MVTAFEIEGGLEEKHHEIEREEENAWLGICDDAVPTSHVPDERHVGVDVREEGSFSSARSRYREPDSPNVYGAQNWIGGNRSAHSVSGKKVSSHAEEAALAEVVGHSGAIGHS